MESPVLRRRLTNMVTPQLQRRSGALLTLALVATAALEAQTGNGSDVTGPNTTGSSVAGAAFVPTALSPVITPLPGALSMTGVPAVSALIPAAVVSTVHALYGGTATLPEESGVAPALPIPAESGIMVVQLAVAPVGSPLAGRLSAALLVQLTTAESGAPSVEAVADLLGLLTGVLSAPTPARIAAAVGAFNAVLEQAGPGYLASMPTPLLAMRVLLGRLALAASP